MSVVRHVLRRRRVRWTAAFVLAVPAALLLHRAGDAARGSPVRELLPASGIPAPGTGAFGAVMSAAGEIDLRPGHGVEILQDDAVMERILEDVAGARSWVTVFSYFCQPGRFGERLAGVLEERARAGVTVLFLGDGFGCGDMVDFMEERLRGSGARVERLRPLRRWDLHRAQHRNHGRSVVVDGTVAFMGGFGLADVWTGGEGVIPWRETSVRFTGPGVRTVQGAFAASWAEATGSLPVLPEEGAGPPAPSHGGVEAGILVSRPGMGPTKAERFFVLTLSAARRTLYIANSYFVPNRETRRLLTDAARRGVDVRILVPGPINDVPGTRWAGQHWFRALLEGGVRIWEYQGTMMHAKTVVADGLWLTVGSVNLDNRSLRLNEEWSLVAQDSTLGARMDSLFMADLGRARERTLEIHLGRPLWDRIREALVSLLAPFF